MFELGNIFRSFGTIPDILMGKKPGDALKDNLMAAAAVGAGMVGAPMLGATAAGTAGPAGGLLGTGSAAGAAAGAESAATAPGWLSTIGAYAKPIGSAASAGLSVKGLLDPQGQGMQAPQPMAQTGTGAQTLAQLVGQNQQAIGNQMQMAEQERLARRRQGFMGGLL